MGLRRSIELPAGARADGCLVIGEVAQTHDGSLGLAHAFVDAIAAAGADAVKFQTHIAAAESTPSEPWRVKFSRQDATRYDYWKRMEWSEPQWDELKAHAEARGLLFVSSPFSLEAVELLARIGMAVWKVASGEVTNTALLDAMIATGKPILLSSGMSKLAELDAAVARVRAADVPFGVLQCTSMYPTPPERVGLRMLAAYRARYGCEVGLSDHSGTIYPGLAAIGAGASVLEVHVTMSRELFGPDVPSSVTTAELRQLVDGVRFLEAMRAAEDGAAEEAKDAIADELTGVRGLFTRSVVVRRALPAGAVLAAEHLAAKKPGTGIAAARLPEMIGRRLRRAVEADQLLALADVEDAP